MATTVKAHEQGSTRPGWTDTSVPYLHLQVILSKMTTTNSTVGTGHGPIILVHWTGDKNYVDHERRKKFRSETQLVTQSMTSNVVSGSPDIRTTV